MVELVYVEMDPAVQRWLARLSPATARINRYHLKRWMTWVAGQAGKFSEFAPAQMIEFQAEAQGRDAYLLLDLIQEYVGGIEGRHGYKVKMYASLRSFFSHNRVQLPADKQFLIHGDRPKATGILKPEVILRVVQSSKGAYRAAFLSMLQGGMDLAGWESWNLTGWPELKAALDRGDRAHVIEMPGRKKFRNIRPYKTRIGRDALDAIREYLPVRPEGTAIFCDQRGRPLSKNSLQLYWKRRLIKLGILKLRRNKDPGNRYGRNLHELRDSFRTLWSMSGAAPHVAEAMMGHIGPDQYGYDKSADDEKFSLEQFAKAEPWLNLVSDGTAFGRVDAGDVEKLRAQVKGLEEELQAARAGQGSEVRQLRAQLEDLTSQVGLINATLNDPATSGILWETLQRIKAAKAAE